MNIFLNILPSLFAGLAAAILAYYIGIFVISVRAAARKSEVRQGNPIVNSPIGPWVLATAVRVKGWMPDYCRSLDEKMVYAGRPSGDLSGAEFLATVLLALIAVLSILMTLLAVNSALGFGTIVFLLFFGFMLALLSIAWLDSEVASRRVSISRDFPYFMDLAVMTLEAGSDFRETLEIYIRDNDEKPLAEEFSITLSEMSMGSVFQAAVGNMVRRVAAEEVQNSLRALMQGERMGTPVAQLFRDQADAIRFKRSQLAERAAEEMKVKLQGPTMMLMMSVLLLILGPAIINIFSSNYF